MAQINWVFLDDNGGRHRVGLYHGDQSGHLMIHCNLRVVQIDFSVRDTKTYSFFIEDELVEIIVERLKTGGFGYEFRVNKTVDTPRNRIRKIENKRNLGKLWLFIAGFVVLISGVFFGLRWYGSREATRKTSLTAIAHNLEGGNAKLLATAGQNTVGTLRTDWINGKQIGIYTFKTADSIEIRGTFPLPATGKVVLQNGFPLSAGDAFYGVYLPTDPQIHRIDLYQPTRRTIEHYIAMALATEMEIHPERTQDQNLCRVLTLAEVRDWTVLADIIFQTQAPEDNPRHNRDAYHRLIRAPESERAFAEKCR